MFMSMFTPPTIPMEKLEDKSACQESAADHSVAQGTPLNTSHIFHILYPERNAIPQATGVV